MESNEMIVGHPAITVVSRAPTMPTITPINAADQAQCDCFDRETASEYARRLAPTAMRTPISLVRSVTDTRRMFMMPMPPTSSDTDAMANSMTVSV